MTPRGRRPLNYDSSKFTASIHPARCQDLDPGDRVLRYHHHHHRVQQLSTLCLDSHALRAAQVGEYPYTHTVYSCSIQERQRLARPAGARAACVRRAAVEPIDRTILRRAPRGARAAGNRQTKTVVPPYPRARAAPPQHTRELPAGGGAGGRIPIWQLVARDDRAHHAVRFLPPHDHAQPPLPLRSSCHWHRC
eukprot:SAG31_NODE_407_length_16049_cov_46.312915_13_plen_193_part_00